MRTQASFILKRGWGGTGRGGRWCVCRWCCKPFGAGALCSCSCPHGCGDQFYKSPAGEMLFSILQLFLSIWMERCHAFKGQSLENRLSCIFQARGNILFKIASTFFRNSTAANFPWPPQPRRFLSLIKCVILVSATDTELSGGSSDQWVFIIWMKWM